MKNILLVFTVLCLFACSDDDSLQEQIVGRWEPVECNCTISMLPKWYHFYSEGSYSIMNWKSEVESTCGTWKIEGDQLIKFYYKERDQDITIKIDKDIMNWQHADNSFNLTLKRIKE